jgi:chromosome segregation ATPase
MLDATKLPDPTAVLSDFRHVRSTRDITALLARVKATRKAAETDLARYRDRIRALDTRANQLESQLKPALSRLFEAIGAVNAHEKELERFAEMGAEIEKRGDQALRKARDCLATLEKLHGDALKAERALGGSSDPKDRKKLEIAVKAYEKAVNNAHKDLAAANEAMALLAIYGERDRDLHAMTSGSAIEALCDSVEEVAKLMGKLKSSQDRLEKQAGIDRRQLGKCLSDLN